MLRRNKLLDTRKVRFNSHHMHLIRYQTAENKSTSSQLKACDFKRILL